MVVVVYVMFVVCVMFVVLIVGVLCLSEDTLQCFQTILTLSYCYYPSFLTSVDAIVVVANVVMSSGCLHSGCYHLVLGFGRTSSRRRLT